MPRKRTAPEAAAPQDRSGEFHPVAGIFPLLLAPELDALAADIAENGFREAIWRHRDGRIIDGRNRWLAGRKVGQEPPSNTYAGPDEGLVPFVISLNLRRRQLSTDQKGAIAAEMAGLASGSNQHARVGASIDAPTFTDAEAAKLFAISEPTVERAKVLLRHAPDLHEKVKAGELKAGAARRMMIERDNAGLAATPVLLPEGAIKAAREVMGGIDLDPASSHIAQQVVKAERYLTKDDDGLSCHWEGRVWLNPPYAASLIGRFVDKLVGHVKAGDVTAAVLLVDNKTDTRWFHQAAEALPLVCFTRGRIGFYRPDQSIGAPTNGSAFFYFGPAEGRFAEVFGAIGMVMRRA